MDRGSAPRGRHQSRERTRLVRAIGKPRGSQSPPPPTTIVNHSHSKASAKIDTVAESSKDNSRWTDWSSLRLLNSLLPVRRNRTVPWQLSATSASPERMYASGAAPCKPAVGQR